MASFILFVCFSSAFEEEKTYPFHPDCVFIIDNVAGKKSDLKDGMDVELTIKDGYVVKVVATTPPPKEQWARLGSFAFPTKEVKVIASKA